MGRVPAGLTDSGFIIFSPSFHLGMGTPDLFKAQNVNMPHQLGIASLEPVVVFGMALAVVTVVLSTIIPVVSLFFLISCSATAPLTDEPPAPLTTISSPNVDLKIST